MKPGSKERLQEIEAIASAMAVAKYPRPKTFSDPQCDERWGYLKGIVAVMLETDTKSTSNINQLLSEGITIFIERQAVSPSVSTISIQLKDDRRELYSGVNGQPSDQEIIAKLQEIIEVWNKRKQF